MADEAIVCHRTPTRIRLRIPSRKGDAPFFAWIQAQLEGLPEISRIEVSALTGSVLLSCRASCERVLEVVRCSSIVSLVEHPIAHRPLARRTVEGFREIDSWVERATDRELDLPSLALVGLIAAGIVQILRGNFTAPAWYTAFWYAASIALKAVPLENEQESPSSSTSAE